MSPLHDNETEQALEAAAEAKAAKKGRNINHAAKCRKAWDAFQAAAKAASEAGVSVTLAFNDGDGSRAQSEELKRFAQHMISDHTRASRRLQATLRNSGMAPPPPQMEARHRQQLEALETSSPNGFDMNYVKLQEQAHQEAIGLFSAYAERGTDARLSAFARETLPTLQMHAQMLDSMPRPR